MLFSREDGTEEFTASYSINYTLFPAYESKDVLDSATYKYNPTKVEAKTAILKEITFKTPSSGTFLLEVSISDNKRKQTSRTFININKDGVANKQSFLVYKRSADRPLFKNYLNEREEVNVLSELKDVDRLLLKYYNSKFPISAPPYSVKAQPPFNKKPDSLANVHLEDGKMSMSFTSAGIYHLISDTANNGGLTFFVYENDFPKLSQPEELIGPLRYITTRQEYSEMKLLNSKKLAVDNFWLNVTGNPDRGRKIIKQFYSRVEEANIFFSSYLEGWKSDRGMIFIVYGPPDVVYKSSTSESWIFGEEGNITSVNFTFYKVENPFSDNDYRLSRSAIYKNSWFHAVDAWRQGIVY
jgi:GWxTD domain-containing protein